LRTLTNKLRQAGFKIEFQRYIFWFLPIPVFLCRTLPSLLRLKKAPTLDQGFKEHGTPKGFVKIILRLLLEVELRFFLRFNKFFGESCLIVGKSPP